MPIVLDVVQGGVWGNRRRKCCRFQGRYLKGRFTDREGVGGGKQGVRRDPAGAFGVPATPVARRKEAGATGCNQGQVSVRPSRVGQ